MIDLHTHTILSDGVLIPSELVRRAQVAGYKAIAITDHADWSNIDLILPGMIRVSEELTKCWDIVVIPGVEITHAPLEIFPEIVAHARKNGAKIVVGHGESPAEPVLTGTNAAAIRSGVDILAHPGHIMEDDARMAADMGVYLEITGRNGHSETNQHVYDLAVRTGAMMVLDTDAHVPEDLFTPQRQNDILNALTDDKNVKDEIFGNSVELVKTVCSK